MYDGNNSKFIYSLSFLHFAQNIRGREDSHARMSVLTFFAIHFAIHLATIEYIIITKLITVNSSIQLPKLRRQQQLKFAYNCVN